MYLKPYAKAKPARKEWEQAQALFVSNRPNLFREVCVSTCNQTSPVSTAIQQSPIDASEIALLVLCLLTLHFFAQRAMTVRLAQRFEI